MKAFSDLVRKYGIGMVLGVATLDGYRRQVLNDRDNSAVKSIEERVSALQEANRLKYNSDIKVALENSKNQAVMGRFNENADNFNKAAEVYQSNPSDVNKKQLEIASKKLETSMAELKKSDISEVFSSLYNNYSDYLDSLTPDKIVCLFNIIMGSLTLTSFVSILSIMLSENVINRIEFLEKYPRILKLLKLRNNINRKVSKFYLLMNLIIILLGILGNLFMFFT